jgi:hypothetical protein
LTITYGLELPEPAAACTPALAAAAIIFTDDARSALVHRAFNESTPDITSRIRHAIAFFRGRDTTAESKRSATVTLAGILEERRTPIEGAGRQADEGALFEIANRC